MNPVSGYEVSSARGTTRVPIGRSYGSDDSPSLSDAPAASRFSFQPDCKSAHTNGKTMFEDSSPDEPETRPTVARDSRDFAQPPPPDFSSDDVYKVGSGPYLFDVNSVPPAPSRLGRVEVERLIHAYKISGTQMEVDPEFIKRLVAFHRGYMVMPRLVLGTSKH